MRKRKFEYKFIYLPSHPNASTNGCVYEHILVAEQILGRYLTKDETVHHIDGNKTNNNPDNLMVFATNSDHILYHNGHSIYEENGVWHAIPVFLICDYCKKEFKKTWEKKDKHVYCSNDCKVKAQRHFEITKEELTELLQKENGNFSKIGRILGVTDNAVRKRCKLFELPTHVSDYKRR